MRFCRECGHELTEDAAFCRECGIAVPHSNKGEVVPTVKTNKQINKKQKATLISIIAAIVVLVGAHLLLDYLFSKDRMIDRLEAALQNHDGKALASLISTSDESMDINEEAVKGLLDFYKENPNEIQVTIETLQRQSVSNGEEVSILESFAMEYEEEHIIGLEEDGKFLFYDKYQLRVLPVYLTIETNYIDTVIFVDGVEVGKVDSDSSQSVFGPFLPGYHTIRGELENGNVALSENDTVFLDGREEMVEIGLYLEAEDISIEMPYRGAKDVTANLYLNGQDTGVNPFEVETYGPISFDSTNTVSVVAELPWGTVETAETQLSSGYFEVNLVNDELRQTLMETVHKHHQEVPLAYTTADATKLTNAHDVYKSWMLERVLEDKENNTSYKIKYLGSIFDLDSISLMNEEGNWEAYIETQVKTEESISDGGRAAPQMQEKMRNLSYTLRFDENAGKWLVVSVDESWGFNPEKIKEFIQSNGVAYESTWATKEVAVSTPTKLDAGLDVEAIVKEIRKEYNKINGGLNQYTKTQLDKNTTIYTNQSQVIKKRIVKSLNAEFYYWDDGSIFFIFNTTNGENRYYFHKDQLIRWINPSKKTINLKEGLNNSQYLQLESEWLGHAY